MLRWVLFCFGCYTLTELACYIRYLKDAATLASYRTGLPPSFDYAEWTRFFADRVRRERAHNPRALLALVSGIFWSRPVTHLHEENVKAMLLMMATAREKHDGPTSDEDASMADDLVSEVNKAMISIHGHPLLYGKDEQSWIRINNPTTNHVVQAPVYQPVLLHSTKRIVRAIADELFRKCLRCERFLCDDTGIVYWVRRNRPVKHGRVLVILHGLGLGAVPYIPFISTLISAVRETYSVVIIPEMPMISGHRARRHDPLGGPFAKLGELRPPYPRSDEIAESMLTFLRERSGHEITDIVCHSYGSTIATYLTTHQPNMIDKIVFLDPICFFTRNSIFWLDAYRPMSTREIGLLFLRGQISRGCKKLSNALIFGDLDHAHVTRNCTWVMEHVDREKLLGENTLLIMGTEDDRVAAEDVASYMAAYNPAVTCHVMRGWRHGRVIFERHSATKMIAAFLNVDS
ncbi:hypothetical protein CYMTET_37421 [Cymbomonas tetramitiformis]|uniref:AB hydrolase-1 domain-containing protein n=1 Tax=Cymbomonas tetramitiformis TaxID=36881 RepID=A0AAE0CDY0_9CHLO|nr:hypothetical protein CYMTET_37421 [Cymbomonas tetramitiformis]